MNDANLRVVLNVRPRESDQGAQPESGMCGKVNGVNKFGRAGGLVVRPARQFELSDIGIGPDDL